MFKRKLNCDAYTNLIAEGTSFDGTLLFSGVMFIQGEVNGPSIAVKDPSKKDDALNVGPAGKIFTQTINATNVVISGVVSADTITAADTVRIHKSAKVHNATIYYRTLEIEPGALLHEVTFKHLDESAKSETAECLRY